MKRVAVALGLCVLGLLYFLHVQRSAPGFSTDLDVQLAAARFLLAGRNPYDLIGPGKEFKWLGTLYQPLPTIITLTPLALLPMDIARSVFVALGSFVFLYAFGGMAGTRWRYAAVFSKSYQAALLAAQWSFFMAAMWILPLAGAFAILKPNIATAVLLARGSRRGIVAAVAAGTVLLAVSLFVMPTWPAAWFRSLATDTHRTSAVTRSWGFLLLLAALRWRRPEARLLFAMSVIPQTIGMYDALLLFFVPKRPSEYIALTVLSHFAFLMVVNDPTIHTFDQLFAKGSASIVHWVYLPTLAMVLIRPNAADT